MYCGAGDNKGCPTNIWKIRTMRYAPEALTNSGNWTIDMINGEPADLKKYMKDERLQGVKPSGILDIDGKLYLSMEAQNYGDNPLFGRQHNLYGWIMVSENEGKTFDAAVTDTEFFTGRLASCHFLQFGRGYEGARDGYVYAYFPYDEEDGQSYWENNDAILLGRVPKDEILVREAWEFFCSEDPAKPEWDKEEKKAKPVFRYRKMTGSNHVAYNAGIGRYIMGNYSFIDEELHPRPIHQMGYPESHISHLTLYEAPEPWGPWKLFHRDDDWGTYGDYQPNFPTQWMTEDGRIMYLVSSGSWDDYNLTVQKMAVKIKGDVAFSEKARYFSYLQKKEK